MCQCFESCIALATLTYLQFPKSPPPPEASGVCEAREGVPNLPKGLIGAVKKLEAAAGVFAWSGSASSIGQAVTDNSET